MSHMPPYTDPGEGTTTLTNEDGSTVAICAPVYLSSVGHFSRSRADTLAHATAIGVATAAIVNGASGSIRESGILVATTAQWDAVTGATGGLTTNAVYYVSPTTAGRLTTTAPSTYGQYIAQVGIAMSATELMVAPQTPILVGNTTIARGIVFIAGQSNSVGQGNIADVGGGWAEPDSNIPMFQQSAPTGGSPVWDVNYQGDLGPYAGAAPNMGCELTLAKTLYAHGNGVIIGKFGQSSTNLAVNWLPTGTYPAAAPNNMYGQMCTYLDNLMTFTGAPLRTFVWIQGESDAVDNTYTAAYAANLTAFMAAFRARYGTQVPIIIVRLNGGITLLPAGNVATVRAAHEAYVASDAKSAIVNTDDLTSVQGATVDYTTFDLMTIGTRCAAAIEPFIAGSSTPVIPRDTTSLKYLPSTAAEWTLFLAGLPGAPANPSSFYNCATLATAGTDANGIQNLTVGSGWTSTPPSGWSRNANTSTDGMGFSIASTAGPIGDPYAASHLIFAMVALTGVPSAMHDVFGCGGAGAFRGVMCTPVGGKAQYQLYDLSGGDSPVGTATYGTTVHPVFLQIDRTNSIARIITDRETITQAPYNDPAVTTPLFSMGAAGAVAGPCQILFMAAWRGAAAEMSETTIAGIMARINTGVG